METIVEKPSEDDQLKQRALHDLEAAMQLARNKPFQDYFMRRVREKAVELTEFILNNPMASDLVRMEKSGRRAQLLELQTMLAEDIEGNRSILS